MTANITCLKWMHEVGRTVLGSEIDWSYEIFRAVSITLLTFGASLAFYRCTYGPSRIQRFTTIDL